MARKRWTPKTEITPELLRFREKRKWQIALRRYVIEKLPSTAYAPYFALDINTIREWFEMQFEKDMTWETFGQTWQFEHVVPINYFDFTEETDLKLCWNFTNLQIENLNAEGNGDKVDILAAKTHFKRLYEGSGYHICLQFLQKIEQIEQVETTQSLNHLAFLDKHKLYLEQIDGFSEFEFELLNKGESVEDIMKEINELKKINL